MSFWTMKNTVSKDLLKQYAESQLQLLNSVLKGMETDYGYVVMCKVDRDILNAYGIKHFNTPAVNKRFYIAYTDFSLHCAVRSRHGRMFLNGYYDYNLLTVLLLDAGLQFFESATHGYAEICLMPNDIDIRKMLIDEWLDDNKD